MQYSLSVEYFRLKSICLLEAVRSCSLDNDKNQGYENNAKGKHETDNYLRVKVLERFRIFKHHHNNDF